MSLFSVMESSARPPKSGFLKALTVHQPYASLIWFLLKQNETRGWATRYRGPIAIHAGMRKIRRNEITPIMTQALAPQLLAVFREDFDIWPYGAIIGVFNLFDCAPIWRLMKEKPISPLEYHCGNYSDGRYAWRLKPIVTFKKPVPIKGLQGLWDVPEESLPEWIAYKKEKVQHV